jgi:hypothetical protein
MKLISRLERFFELRSGTPSQVIMLWKVATVGGLNENSMCTHPIVVTEQSLDLMSVKRASISLSTQKDGFGKVEPAILVVQLWILTL